MNKETPKFPDTTENIAAQTNQFYLLFFFI